MAEDNGQFESLINNVTKDINTALKTNLNKYINVFNENNKVVSKLKEILILMPEYVALKEDYVFLESIHSNLIKEHEELKENYDKLVLQTSGDVKNINLDISEKMNTSNDTITALSSNKVIKINKEEVEEETEEEETEEEETEEETEEEVEEEEEEVEEEVEKENCVIGDFPAEEAIKVEVVEEEAIKVEEEAIKVEEEAIKVEEEEEEDESEEDESEEETEEEEEEEEEEELVEITIKDKKYYKNEDNNDLYSVLEDGEPGELIGKYVNNKIEKRK